MGWHQLAKLGCWRPLRTFGEPYGQSDRSEPSRSERSRRRGPGWSRTPVACCGSRWTVALPLSSSRSRGVGSRSATRSKRPVSPFQASRPNANRPNRSSPGRTRNHCPLRRVARVVDAGHEAREILLYFLVLQTDPSHAPNLPACLHRTKREIADGYPHCALDMGYLRDLGSPRLSPARRLSGAVQGTAHVIVRRDVNCVVDARDALRRAL